MEKDLTRTVNQVIDREFSTHIIESYEVCHSNSEYAFKHYVTMDKGDYDGLAY